MKRIKILTRKNPCQYKDMRCLKKYVIFEDSSEHFDWKVQEGSHLEVPKYNQFIVTFIPGLGTFEELKN
jgi:hypothetical protein